MPMQTCETKEKPSKRTVPPLPGAAELLEDYAAQLKQHLRYYQARSLHRSKIRGMRCLFSAVDTQQCALDLVAKLGAALHHESEARVRSRFEGTALFPEESKELVQAWMELLETGSKELHASLDTSLVLLGKYLARRIAEEKERPPERPPARKKTPPRPKLEAAKERAIEEKKKASKKRKSQRRKKSPSAA